MSDKITTDEKKGFSFKSILVSIGTYLLFFLSVFFISSVLNNQNYAVERTSLLLVTVIEILIFRGIASLFIKKKPQLALIIGIILTTLLHLPSIYFQISSYQNDLWLAGTENIEKDFPFLVYSAREKVGKGFLNYIFSWLLSESHFIPILLNSVFLFSYRKSRIRNERWGKTLLSIIKSFLPIIGILGYFVLILSIFPGISDDGRALLNIVASLLILNIYLLTRLRKSKIQKQKKELGEKKSKYKIVPTIIFASLIIQGIYLLTITSFPLAIANLVVVLSFSLGIYLFFKKILWGIYMGGIGIIIWCVERIVTSYYIQDVGLRISSVMFSITVLLLLLNLYLVYRNPKESKKEKVKTLKEIYGDFEKEEEVREDVEKSSNPRTIKDTYLVPNRKVNKIILWGLAISIFVLIWVGIFSLLGFRVNKEYFSYDVNVCVEDNWVGDKYHDGIDDCVYWARYNDLIKNRDLESEWNNKREELRNCPDICTSYQEKETYEDLMRYLSCSDPTTICDYADYVDYVHHSNKGYLKSKDRDVFFNQCVEEYCKRPALITVQ